MKITKQELKTIIKEELQFLKEGKGSRAAEKNKRYMDSISGATDFDEDTVNRAREYKNQLAVLVDEIMQNTPSEKHPNLVSKAKYLQKQLNDVIGGISDDHPRALEISQYAELISRGFNFKEYARSFLK